MQTDVALKMSTTLAQKTTGEMKNRMAEDDEQVLMELQGLAGKNRWLLSIYYSKYGEMN